jgi:hypothetical protein
MDMNVTKLIGMLQAAGYDDSKAGAAAFEGVNLIAFFEAYRKAIEDEAPGRDAIEQAVKDVLSQGKWPEYCTEDDRGLEPSEYAEFFQDVLTSLLLTRFARAKPVRLHGDDEDSSAAGLLERQGERSV